MKSGFIRPEIYQEVRHKLDGNGAITDNRSASKKKKRLDPESEILGLRASISA
jgi:hypothetical protein